MKDTEVFRSVPVWRSPPRPDLRKHMRGVTLRAIIDKYKTKRQALRLRRAAALCPYHENSRSWPPHSTSCGRDEDCMASGDFWLIASLPPVSGNKSRRQNQTNGYTAVGEAMLPGPQPGHYVGVRDLWPGLRTQTCIQGQCAESTPPSFPSSP
jgi:hypothetical protein